MIDAGTIIDERYEIVSTIGAGGFGTIVKARQLQFDRLVAVKLLKTTMLEDPEGLPRFEREAKAINALKHKNIVGIYGYGVWHKAPYMVMEMLEGKSLEQILAAGRLEPTRALRIIAQVFEALDFAHRNGVVHRDLKPSNIMLVTDSNNFEVVKIIDFGLAKLLPSYGVAGQKLTETGYALGTCHYMAPEQARGNPVDQRADIYAAGCILQQALTDELPFDGDNNIAIMYRHLDEQPPALAKKLGNSKQTAALQILIDNCLAKAAKDRYANGAAAARDALSLADGRYDSIVRFKTKTEWPGKSTRLPASKNHRPALILALLSITCIFCLLWLGTKGKPFTSGPAPNSSDLAGRLIRQLNNTLETRVRLAPELENALRLNEQDKALNAEQAYCLTDVLADVHYQQGHFSKAEQYSKQALEHRFRIYGNWLNGKLTGTLAIAQLAQGKTDQALATLEGALVLRKQLERQDVGSVACYLNALLLTVYIDQEQFTKAEEVSDWLRKHLKQADFYQPLCLVTLGDLQLAKRNYAAAQLDFQDALKCNWGFNDWGWLGLARTELYQRHFALAAKYADKALAVNRQGQPQDASFPMATSYLILTASSAAKKDAASVKELFQKLKPELALSSPAKLNDRDIAIASKELHNAGLDSLVSELRLFSRSTLPPTGPGMIRR